MIASVSPGRTLTPTQPVGGMQAGACSGVLVEVGCAVAVGDAFAVEVTVSRMGAVGRLWVAVGKAGV